MKVYAQRRREYPDGFDVACAVPGCGAILPTLLLAMRHRDEHDADESAKKNGKGGTDSELSKFDPRAWRVVV